MKSDGSYSIVRSVHRDSVTSFNVSCENGDRHFLYTLLGADSFKLANQPPLAHNVECLCSWGIKTTALSK